MKKILLFLVILSTFLFNNASAQIPAVINYLDINNVKAGIMTHGDMFWNYNTQNASYEFPKGSGLHCGFATTLWIAGYDQNTSNLRIAAQTYRQSGTDYWPGPLDANSLIDSTTSSKWDKLWKINKSTIDSFLLISPHTVFNTHPSILDWPAKGNPYATDKFNASLSVIKEMAPFVDINSDGNYNALDGDYPKIKGEQALWWVFNDVKPHLESNGDVIGLEIKSMAYACNSIPALQNVTFYSFDIQYVGSTNLIQTRIGLYNDIDLGYAFDDYIGVDTVRRLGYAYNSDNYDEGPTGYGLDQTICGVQIVKSPSDSAGYIAPLGSFSYYTNTFGSMGNPSIDTEFNHILRGSWRDGLQFTETCNGRDNGIPTSFVFTGNPCDTNAWSEKQCMNAASDKRFIMTTNDFTFTPGATKNLTLAVINTPRSSDSCNFTLLQAMADTVSMYPDGCSSFSPTFAFQPQLERSVTLFPNPTDQFLTIQWSEFYVGKIKNVLVTTTLGEKINLNPTVSASKVIFDTKHLPIGIYLVQVQTDSEKFTTSFLKK